MSLAAPKEATSLPLSHTRRASALGFTVQVRFKRAGFPVARCVAAGRGRKRDLNSSQHSTETGMVCIILILDLAIILVFIASPTLGLLRKVSARGVPRAVNVN